jgi:hypothetical protein
LMHQIYRQLNNFDGSNPPNKLDVCAHESRFSAR